MMKDICKIMAALMVCAVVAGCDRYEKMIVEKNRQINNLEMKCDSLNRVLDIYKEGDTHKRKLAIDTEGCLHKCNNDLRLMDRKKHENVKVIRVFIPQKDSAEVVSSMCYRCFDDEEFFEYQKFVKR